MKAANSLRYTLLAWLLVGTAFSLSAVAAEDSPSDDVTMGEKAICHVCRVHEGETRQERVRATAEYQGQIYGFCSPACSERFLEDPESYLPPVLPRPAPAFTVLDLEGTEVEFESFRGKVVLLDFWATWCPPCVKDLPDLTRLHERYQEDGLVVLSVSIDEGDDAAAKVEAMVEERRAKHPVFLDATEASAWSSYRVKVVPTQYLIDAQGQIVGQWSGKIDLAVVEAEIVRLLEDTEPER